MLISDVIGDVKWTTKVPSPLTLARHAMQFFPHKYLAQHTHANVIDPRYHTGQYIHFLENLILLDKIFTTPPPIMIAKSRLKHLLSNHGPCDITMQQERHKWLCDVMNVMHSNRCIVSIWNACKVPPSAAIRQDNLGKYTSSCEQYINCGKLMNILYWKLWTSSRISSRGHINFLTIFCSHF